MRRLRYAVAAALLAVLVVTPLGASAASLEDHGWWWRAQTGLLGADLPPPPDVPEDGLLVERAPDGATAISALRFRLADGESAPVLTLTVASGDPSGAAIAACQTSRVAWSGEYGGRWDAAPSFDCQTGRVDGVASEDGATWSWELAPLVRDGGVISVMLVDGTQTPFRVAFEPPTDSSLTTTTAPPPPPPAPEPPPPAPAQPQPESQEQPPPPPTRPADPVVVPPAVPNDAGAPAAPEPEVAQPEASGTTTGTAPQPQPVAAPATEDTGLSPLALGLMLAILLLLGADVLRDRAVVADVPRGSDTTTGGIGRFARERDAPPDPLW